MAIASPTLSETKGRLTAILGSDFCPGLNRYVDWLKEPIGWFLIAVACSVLIGMHVSSVGWVLASVITCVTTVGMALPWLAVRAARCRLEPARAETHEGERCDLILSVRNRLPIPLWGLAIEGYLDREGDELQPTIALACVPLLSEAEYRLAMAPDLRGHYPLVPPLITCSMPFGIWTARRRLTDYAPLTVFPKVMPVRDEPGFTGGRLADCGDGRRAGQVGEPLGVREYRGGDRLRNIHWVHTARTGVLTVCERGGPQQPTVDLVLDADTSAFHDPETRLARREVLARQVRIAASVAVALHARRVPVRVHVGTEVFAMGPGPLGRRKLLAALADIPADGFPIGEGSGSLRGHDRQVTLVIRPARPLSLGAIRVELHQRGLGNRDRAEVSTPDRRGLPTQSLRIEPCESLDLILSRFWLELNHDAVVA